MNDYLADVAAFTTAVDDAAIAAIVRYCGIALRNPDSALVSGTDPKELGTVRHGFAAKKLGLDAAAADAGMRAVLAQMQGVQRKSRVTFYYLLAQATGTLAKLR